MNEQEIIAILKEHVARSQSSGGNGHAPVAAPAQVPRVDVSQLDQVSAELLRLRGRVGQLNPRNAGLINRALQAFKKALQRSLSWYTRSLNEYHDGVNHAIDYHARAIANLQHQVLQLGGGMPELIEESLRTSRRATQEQQAPYVHLFREVSPVLDLGCGRGEFLELLRHEGVSAYGVDSDRLACDEARRRSLKVIQADLLEHLQQVPERSLGGIFSSRVIEYLAPHQHAQLIQLCAATLKPGGVLVMETINPDSDFPFGRNSHLDPTHLRAVYPEVMTSMLQSAGFEDCNVCVLAPQQVCVAAGAQGSQSQAEAGPLVPIGILRAPAYAAIARRS